MEKRPVLEIKKKPIDWLLESIAGVAILLLFAIPIYFYNTLPEQIPRHFDLQGKPDAYGSRDLIWVLPVIGVILYLLMTFINRFPHYFNYPTPITPENAHQQYTSSIRLMRTLKMLMSCIFCYLSYSTVQVGLQQQTGLSPFFLPVFLLAVFLPIGLYLYRTNRKRL